jgi:hypothetical protein
MSFTQKPYKTMTIRAFSALVMSAAALQSLGYQPAGVNGTWEQPFDVVGVTAKAPEIWSFAGKSGKADLKWYPDWIADSGVQTDTASVNDAEVVFVGYGRATRSPMRGCSMA